MSAHPPRTNWPAWAGIALGAAGIAAYLVVVFRLGDRLTWVRNEAVPNLALVALGLVLSTIGVAGAWRRPPRYRGPALAAALAALNLAGAAAFGWLLFGMTALPPAVGPAVGTPAPDFALVDQQRAPVRLADFRGAPLLLVFYRGHW